MYPADHVAGAQLAATELNDGLFNPVYTYGETIAVGDALYFKASDSKVYKTTMASIEASNNFVGFAKVAGVANDTKRILGPGKIVTGLSGLTAGTVYYLASSAGTLSATPGTFPVEAGIAVSTTSLLVFPSAFKARGHFADGSDGDITFDGSTNYNNFSSRSGSTYTLTRNVYGKTVINNSGVTVKTAGFQIYATKSLTNAGTISCDGENGANGVTTTAGAGGAGGGGGTTGAGSAGGTGGSNALGAPTAGGSLSEALGATGGAGGTSGSQSGSAAGVATAAPANYRAVSVTDLMINPSTLVKLKGGCGGGAGGAGNGGGIEAAGGGGGGGGGICWIAAPAIVNTGTIRANGGNGGNGATSSNSGGGGTGGGGSVFLRYFAYLNSGTVQANAGATVGNGNTAGSPGSLGSAGQVITVAMA